MKKIIEVKNLTKEYKNLKAIDNLSFDVFEGEILGLLGPNGSGKSTTINSILQLLNYSSGSIKIFGHVMKPDSYEIKKDIGVIFQEVAVFQELTVYENIDYFCGLYINDKEIRRKYVMDAINLVGLNDFIKFYPKELSGGLLRRLNIACGIAHKPKLIFLDEPTVAVDPQSRNNILDGIKKLRDEGATIVYTTHYMEEVEIICDRIIILDKGKIIAKGTTDELKTLAKLEEKITVEVKNISEEILKEIKEFKTVLDLNYQGNVLVVVYKKGKDNLGELIDYLHEKKVAYSKTFIFPIILGTFFKLAFKDIENNEAFHPFDIAVIESNDFNNNEIFKEAIKSVSKSDNKLFNVKYVSKSDANKLLEDKDITGYLEFIGNDVNIKINNNGIYETILKFFVDEVNSEKNIINLSINEEVSKGNYDIDNITSNILDKLNSEVNIKNISRSNLSYTMIEYYTLIAMAALYGGILSMYIINKSMPNLSDVGKRSSIAPVKKSDLILSGLLASIIVQFVGLIILFLYTIFVLKINYDSNIWYIVLLAIVGSIAGLSLGVFIASIFKVNENAKSGILIAITMFYSFLSGMMGITMKYVIDKNIPIINKINPAALITDGFYSLYYDTLNRYFFNVISLILYSFILLSISSIVLRRQKYDSI